MVKGEVYTLRWDPELRAKVQDYAKSHGYEDVASFIRAVLRERTESDGETESLRKTILELLAEDPTLFDSAIKRVYDDLVNEARKPKKEEVENP